MTKDCISPLVRWKDSSLAVCELHVDRVIRAYRNGKRPLYLTTFNNGCIITSTENIPARAGIEGFTTEIPLNTYITFDDALAMMVEKETIAVTSVRVRMVSTLPLFVTTPELLTSTLTATLLAT